MKLALISLLLFVAPMAGLAQVGVGAVANLGISRASNIVDSGSVTGVGFAGGGAVRFNRFVGFAALDASTYKGAMDPRYIQTTDSAASGARTHCRELRTMQFAENALCVRPTRAVTGGMFDGNVLLRPWPIIAGAGYRYTSDKQNRRPYGTAGYARPFDEKGLWFARVIAGPSIFQIHIGIANFWP